MNSSERAMKYWTNQGNFPPYTRRERREHDKFVEQNNFRENALKAIGFFFVTGLWGNHNF